MERGQYREECGRLQQSRIKGAKYRAQYAGTRSYQKKGLKKMSLNKAIETQFITMRNNDRYTPEGITKFAHRWTMKRRRKREYRICLD